MNTFLPPPSAGANIQPSVIGPGGMAPAGGGGGAGGAGAMAGLGDLAHALMLAKMRGGQPPLTAHGNFSPGAAAGSQMAPLQPPIPPSFMGGGPQGPMVA